MCLLPSSRGESLTRLTHLTECWLFICCSRYSLRLLDRLHRRRFFSLEREWAVLESLPSQGNQAKHTCRVMLRDTQASLELDRLFLQTSTEEEDLALAMGPGGLSSGSAVASVAAAEGAEADALTFVADERISVVVGNQAAWCKPGRAFACSSDRYPLAIPAHLQRVCARYQKFALQQLLKQGSTTPPRKLLWTSLGSAVVEVQPPGPRQPSITITCSTLQMLILLQLNEAAQGLTVGELAARLDAPRRELHEALLSLSDPAHPVVLLRPGRGRSSSSSIQSALASGEFDSQDSVEVNTDLSTLSCAPRSWQGFVPLRRVRMVRSGGVGSPGLHAGASRRKEIHWRQIVVDAAIVRLLKRASSAPGKKKTKKKLGNDVLTCEAILQQLAKNNSAPFQPQEADVWKSLRRLVESKHAEMVDKQGKRISDAAAGSPKNKSKLPFVGYRFLEEDLGASPAKASKASERGSGASSGAGALPPAVEVDPSQLPEARALLQFKRLASSSAPSSPVKDAKDANGSGAPGGPPLLLQRQYSSALAAGPDLAAPLESGGDAYALDAEGARALLRDMAGRTSKVLGVPLGHALRLLSVSGWSVDQTVTTYLEAPEVVRFQAGLGPRGSAGDPAFLRTPEGAAVQCPLCDDAEQGGLALWCGHFFCIECWQGNIRAKFESIPPLNIRCMMHVEKCTACFVPELLPSIGFGGSIAARWFGAEVAAEADKVEFPPDPRTGEPTDRHKLEEWGWTRMVDSCVDQYVASNPGMEWCKNKRCRSVIVASESSDGISAEACPSCKSQFCGRCDLVDHRPATCKQLTYWTDIGG